MKFSLKRKKWKSDLRKFAESNLPAGILGYDDDFVGFGVIQNSFITPWLDVGEPQLINLETFEAF